MPKRRTLNKAQRTTLNKAIELLGQAEQLVIDVKEEVRGMNGDDDFYALEHIAYEIGDCNILLTGHIK